MSAVIPSESALRDLVLARHKGGPAPSVTAAPSVSLTGVVIGTITDPDRMVVDDIVFDGG